MTLSPRMRRAALGVHVTVSVGWIGAVVAYLALGITAVSTDQDTTIRSAWVAMEVLGWSVIVPLAVGSLATGLMMAIGTPWGLFRHYWVVISLVMTAAAVAALVLHMPDVSAAADIARTASSQQLGELGGDLPHTVAALVVLLVVNVLNIVKPRGRTRAGAGRRRTSPTAA